MAAPPWVILARVVRVRLAPGAEEAGEAEQAEHAAAAAEPGFAAAMALPPRLTALAAGVEAGEEEHAAAAAEPDFAAAVALPARVTVLAAGRGAHPDAEKPDGYPYIVTAGSDYLLAHFAAAPSYGTRFDDNPDSSHLVLVSRFNAAGGETTASAERVPDRAGGVPNLRNIGNVILYSCVGGDYRIAELQVDTGRDLATIVYLRLRSSHAEGWSTRQVAYPLSAEGRNWIPDGTVYADGTLWWFDLSWGILSCSATLSEANLLFHQFPGHAEDTTSVHTKRWVTASRGKLRYVAIIIPEGGGPARVSMWTRMMDDKGWNWYPKYSVSFEKIWNDKSYEETELPRNVPELVIVCPSNPDLVYFAVEKHIIGVNVPEHRVVDDKAFGQETLNMPGPPRPASGRYFIAWELPSTVARGNLASKARDKEQQLLQERTAASSSAGAKRTKLISGDAHPGV
ncbi:unnamed protein product [Urochloa decumbens]|uniref:DUF1618 domain-containing protein n=1 Tax=Urochloa decumbens TaxID=240449 RepID=A0ABC8W560_9POAL